MRKVGVLRVSLLAPGLGLLLAGCGVTALKPWSSTTRIPQPFPGDPLVSVRAVPAPEQALLPSFPYDLDRVAMMKVIRDAATADLKENVFYGEKSPQVETEIVVTTLDRVGRTMNAQVSVNLTTDAGTRQLGKYSAEGRVKFPLFGNLVQAATPALKEAMEGVKKQMVIDREAVLSRMKPAPALAAPVTGGKLAVAVAELAAEGVPASSAAIAADWLRGALVQTGTVAVVERQNMVKILAEQGLQQTGCTQSDCAVKLGKLLNVQRMVVGSFGKFLDANVLTIRVVDIESGQVVYSDTARGKTSEEMEVAIRALASRLAGR